MGKSLGKHINLVRSFAKEYNEQMTKLGFRQEALDSFIEIRSDEKNLPLYDLAFYSKHKTGYDFWGKVKKRNTELSLFD
jgi:hypothetical protein